MKSLSCIRLLATPWSAAYQAPPSMGFSRQVYWSGVPLPSLIHVSSFLKDSIRFSSVTQSCLTLWDSMDCSTQASLSITNSWSLLKLMFIESVMPSNHLILCRPLLLPPSIFPSIRVFSHESILHIRWSGYWSFSFNISPSNEYSGLISFRMDWLGLFAVPGTLKSLLQHHSSKASILWGSAFFIVQLSHPYMTGSHTKTWASLVAQMVKNLLAMQET